MTQDQLKEHVAILFSRRYNCEFTSEFVGDVQFAYNHDLNFFLFYTAVPFSLDNRYHCVVTSGNGQGKIYTFFDIHYYDTNVIAKDISFDIHDVQDKARRWLLAVANNVDDSLLTVVK